MRLNLFLRVHKGVEEKSPQQFHFYKFNELVHLVVHFPPNPSPQHFPHTITMEQEPSPPPLACLSYMADLNLRDLKKLNNNPIVHHPTWPKIPAKLPSYIPKF